MTDAPDARSRDSIRTGAVNGIAAFAVLLALSLLVNANVLRLRPLGGDNLYVLDWAARTPATGLLRVEPSVYPEWRPVAYLTVWLQYRVIGLGSDLPGLGVPSYFLVNLIVWTCCAWLVYRLVVELTKSGIAGILAGVLVVADARSASAVSWIVERQSSLACGFGLLAVLAALVADGRRISAYRSSAVFIFLLASGLSKEFGLAFAAGLVIWAWPGRRPIALAAASAVLAYVVLRTIVAGGAVNSLCEEMGYMTRHRDVCMNAFSLTTAAQALYNVTASAIGILVPGLFDGTGAIAPAIARLPASLVWLSLAVIGWTMGGRSARLFGLIVGFNAALSFMLYRERNQLVGLCALAVAAGIGLANLQRLVSDRTAGRSARRATPVPVARRMELAAAAVLLILLSVEMYQTRRVVRSVVEQALAEDPCESLTGSPAPDPEFVTAVKRTYAMSDPACAGAR